MVATIFDIPEASPATLAALPAEALLNLQEQAAAHMAHASQIVAALHGALAARYASGVPGTGTHHYDDNGIAVTVTLPKRVKWDQTKLVEAVNAIKGWGEDPADYVDTEIKVAERKYDAWPPAIRDLFTPARTLETGKPTIKLDRAKKEAA